VRNIPTPSDTTGIPTVWVGIESGRADKGSPESQLRAIGDHAPATEDRFCVGTFAESGKTGFKGERGPELAAAIAAAKAAAAEFGEAELWCFHTSRLARGSGRKGERSYMKLWADLFEADVQVRSVTDDEFAIRPMLVGLASEQNHKYSADLSAHVKRGKGDQRARGERPGGPINDGYVMEVVERDAKGKATKRRFDFNPTRQPTIARMFELSLSGIPDARVGRTLNAEGHRTERGGYWDRRKVEDKVTNPVYCGAVIWYRGKANEEVIWDPPTPMPAYITREQFEQIIATRKGRDKGPKGKARAGRKNKRHLMAKLAYCEDCGDEMRTITSSWIRVGDGTKNYTYQCQHVKAGDGMCHAPDVNGEVADLQLAEYLPALFADGVDFLARIGVERNTQRDGVEADRDREAAALAKQSGAVTKLQRRYRDLVADGDDDRAEAVEGALTEARAEVGQIKHRLGEYDAILAAAPDPADAILDVYAIVKAKVSDALGRAGVAEIRAGLAETFERFTLGTNDEGEVVLKPHIRVENWLGGPIVGIERIAPAPVGNGQDIQL
jgi:hypothetical protein